MVPMQGTPGPTRRCGWCLAYPGPVLVGGILRAPSPSFCNARQQDCKGGRELVSGVGGLEEGTMRQPRGSVPRRASHVPFLYVRLTEGWLCHTLTVTKGTDSDLLLEGIFDHREKIREALPHPSSAADASQLSSGCCSHSVHLLQSSEARTKQDPPASSLPGGICTSTFTPLESQWGEPT